MKNQRALLKICAEFIVGSLTEENAKRNEVGNFNNLYTGRAENVRNKFLNSEKFFHKVSIIILNWNGWNDTIECLESLYQITYPNYDIIVIDNGSKDESIKNIRQWANGKIIVESKFFNHKQINKPIKIVEYTKDEIERNDKKQIMGFPSSKNLIIIKNEKNLGFAEGNNIGMRFAFKTLSSDYILLLNNDTVVDKTFLDRLVNVADSDERIGIVGPKNYYYDFKGRKDVILFNGGKINWIKFPGYFPIDQGRIETPTKNLESRECDWITGAAMMIRVKHMPINLLNTEFFFGCEDVDLCINIKDRGYKIIAVSNSKIWHKVGASRKKRSKNFIKGLNRDIRTNLKFLKMHSTHYYIFLPLYILDTIKIYCATILKILV